MTEMPSVGESKSGTSLLAGSPNEDTMSIVSLKLQNSYTKRSETISKLIFSKLYITRGSQGLETMTCKDWKPWRPWRARTGDHGLETMETMAC